MKIHDIQKRWGKVEWDAYQFRVTSLESAEDLTTSDAQGIVDLEVLNGWNPGVPSVGEPVMLLDGRSAHIVAVGDDGHTIEVQADDNLETQTVDARELAFD